MDRRSLAFDRIADQYDATRGGEARGVKAAGQLAPWLDGGPVLEVGVGTGVVAAALRAKGYEVAGVDLSPAMLAHAAQRIGPGRLAVADARRLPVRTGSVSAVVFVYSLHVIGDVDAALAQAARVLRPGGRVVAIHGGAADDQTDIFDAAEPISPLRKARLDVGPAILRAGQQAGLRPIWQGPTETETLRETPRGFLRSIHDKVWSWLWDIDDEAWDRHVAPAIARLEALPDQDRPREFGQRHLVTVFAKPGGDRAAERRAFLDHRRAVSRHRYDTVHAAGYDAGWGEIQPTHRSYVDRLVATVPEGGRVLDAGCGTGKYWPLLREAGRDVVGVDQSAEMLIRAEAKYPEVPTRQVALQDLAGEPALTGFDGLICVDALENVGPEDWPTVLAGFRHALRPGGPAYLTVELPERPLPETESALLEPGELLAEGGYHYYPARDRVLGWLAEAGFTVADEETADGYWHLLVRGPA